MAQLTYREAVSATLAREMERDENVIVLGEDVQQGGVMNATKGLLDRFGGNRIWNTPISEQAILGCAMGAAMAGIRPVAEIMFADFLATCWDFVANEIPKACYTSDGQITVPLVIRTASGGGLGFGAHHSQTAESWAMCIPGLKIVAPSNPADVKGLLSAAIRDNDPVLFFEQKALYPTKGEVPDGDYVLPIGRASVVRHGSDLSLVGLGSTVPLCLQAADILAEESGIQTTVIDLRSLIPLDAATVLSSVRETGRVLVVEEGPEQLGWGTTVISILASEAFSDLSAPPRRITSANVPSPSAANLEAAAHVSVERVVRAAQDLSPR